MSNGSWKPGTKVTTSALAGIGMTLFWEMVITSVSEEMARGTFAELVASKLDRAELEARIGEHDRKDLSILLRRVASYVYTGW